MLLVRTVQAQNTCTIEALPETNAIKYNREALEKIIPFGDTDAIFFGESHSRNFDPAFKYHFITHLNERYGVRDIFMEIGKSAAYIYNQFLQSGDTSIFKKYSLVYNQGYYKNFWIKLYAFNASRPVDLQLRIHGVDFERTEIFKLLLALKSEMIIVPDHLQNTFTEIKLLAEDRSLFTFDEKFVKAVSSVKKIFKQNNADFEKIYGGNCAIVADILNNNAPVTSKVNPRNHVWYSHMKSAIDTFQIHKFVAFFGRSHTNEANEGSLPQLFKKANSSFRIISIAGIYHQLQGYGKSADELVIYEYGYKEKDLYEQNANKNCRANMVAFNSIIGNKPTVKADYYLFIKDLMVIE